MKRKIPKKTRQLIKAAFVGVDRLQLAQSLKSTVRTIDQIANGLLPVSPKRAKDIERATRGAVTAELLKPDVFGK